MSKVKDQKSNFKGRGSRVKGQRSNIQSQGSQVKCQGSSNTIFLLPYIKLLPRIILPYGTLLPSINRLHVTLSVPNVSTTRYIIIYSTPFFDYHILYLYILYSFPSRRPLNRSPCK